MSDDVELMTLRIAQKQPAAQDIEFFELRRPDDGDLPEFTPGAHLSLRVPNGELRKYSLCNDPAERDHYCIAVKRETNGRGGSVSLIDHAKVGDDIQVEPPRNDFELAKSPQYLFIAGGIGITPILSMIRHIRATGEGRFKLFYLSRSPEMTAFLDELKQPEFRGMVTIHHDGGNPDDALDLWPVLEKPGAQHLYCCGPRALMQAVRDMTGHWSTAKVHFEDFTPPGAMTKPEDKPFRVKVAGSGASYEVPVGKTILEVLRENGHAVPSSCESGTCGSCKTKLVEGEVDHRDLVLSDYEQPENIMVCVSRAMGDEITIDL
ncbi:MAG: phthalate 4,5-dioxygenase [Hyphomicrobiales bacterium]|nr:phthalate 4,5-dioxygenase [Hyphomicrobiales bacterium]